LILETADDEFVGFIKLRHARQSTSARKEIKAMSKKQPVTWLTIIAFAVIVTLTTFVRSPGARAQDNQDKHDERDSRIARGLEIAPVPLNLEGKNRALIGLGSYLVNAVASCNDCHSAGPQTQFAAGGNPYFGQPTKENPATYLGGGEETSAH
jgi:hypothetical protein